MESLYLNKPDSLMPIIVRPEITKQLKSHQTHGLRFLYRNIANNQGAILNDSEDLGKRATIAALIHAILQNNSSIFSSALILCSDEFQVDKWNYILQTFTGMETRMFNDNDSRGNCIVVEQFGASITNLQTIVSSNFDIVILEWPNLEKWRAIKLHLSRIKTRNRIIIANRDLQDKLEDLWESVEWIRPGSLGYLKNFLKKYSTNNRRTHQILSSLLRDIYLKRNINDINVKDLPIIDEKVHTQLFENWKGDQNLKLLLSDSQTSSDSQSTNNIESIPKKEKTKVQPKTNNFCYFEPSLSSEESLDSNEIGNNKRPDIFEKDTGNSEPKNNEEYDKSNNVDAQNSTENIISSKSSESLEIVSAHVVSPSNYTSDETFEALNFLFPSNENNPMKKRRSPKRRKIADPKWLSCPKTTNTENNQGSRIDLMCSSDESIFNSEIPNEIENNREIETTQGIINRTLIKLSDTNLINKTKNSTIRKSYICQRGRSSRDNEAENIIDTIFFS